MLDAVNNLARKVLKRFFVDRRIISLALVAAVVGTGPHAEAANPALSDLLLEVEADEAISDFGRYSPKLLADALTYFAQKNDVERLNEVLPVMAVDALNSAGGTALIAAVVAGAPKAVQRLLDAGADPLLRTQYGNAVEVADLAGSSEIMKMFGNQVRTPETVLREAARKGDAGEVARVVSVANANSPDENGTTPLIEALISGCRTCAEVLLRYNADPNKASNSGISPIGLAILANDLGMVRLLLSWSADVNQKVNGLTLLQMAVMATDVKIVDELLKAGADPKVAGEDGVLPSHFASVLGRKDIAGKLGGEEPQKAAKSNLVAAVAREDEAGVVKALKEGGDPNQSMPGGLPVLVHAAAYSSSRVLSELLEAGADPLKRGPNKALPVQVALADPDLKQRVWKSWLLVESIKEDQMANFLRLTDGDDRSVLVSLALRANGQAHQNAFKWAIERLPKGFDVDDLVHRPDRDGVTAADAAVLSDNGPAISAMVEAGVRFENLPGKGSAQDLARARKAWWALSALPSDRTVPSGLKRGKVTKETRKEMQFLLKRWGYYHGEADGAFGPASQAAMVQFLKDQKSDFLGMANAPNSYASVTRGGDMKLVVSRYGDPCSWTLMVFNDGTEMIGCHNWYYNSPDTSSFGLITFPNGSTELSVYGADGINDRAPL